MELTEYYIEDLPITQIDIQIDCLLHELEDMGYCKRTAFIMGQLKALQYVKGLKPIKKRIITLDLT